jgi:6-pyruvoyltetrahydropterin/6-carboxytetrahydropterin synthase
MQEIVLFFAIFLAAILLSSNGEFTLGVRDSIMIAHSFKGEEFGPAQNLHGATYTVDVDFQSSDLVENSNWVIDIGLASDILSEVLRQYNFKNLDELFPNINTTTEFMCKVIHGELKDRLCKKSKFKGKLSVKL